MLGLTVTLVFLLGFYLVRKREERGWLMGLAVGAFLLKAILVPLYFQWLVSIGEYGFAYRDASGYHAHGASMAEEIRLDLPRTTSAWNAIDPGFYRITAYTYMLFGPNTLIIRFFLIMCVSMSLLYVYRITRLYFDEGTARLAAGLQAFLPLPILISMNHRKDMLVQLIVLFMFYHAVRVFRQDPGWLRDAAWVVFGLALVYPFRSGLILPFIGVLLICFVFTNRNLPQAFGLTLVALIGLVALQFAVPEGSRISLDTYTERTEGKLAGSAVRSDVGGLVRVLRVTGPLDIYKVPFAASAYLILPFPPVIETYEVSALNSFLNLASIFLLPHMLLGAWSLIRGPNWRRQLPLLVFPIVFLLVLGAVHVGLTRYKQIFYPICLIWAAVGWRIGTGFVLKLVVYGGLVSLASIVYLSRFGFF